MEQLRQALLQLANASKTGARVKRLDDTSFALVDCDNWSDLKSRRLRALFPSVDVEFQASHGKESLSNFMVITRLPPVSHTRWVEVFAFALAVVVGLVWRLLA